MANPIKYTTSTQSNSIKAGNFAVGVNKGGYGPTNVTYFYNGKTPNYGGYTVYVANGTASPSPFVASNDAALITLSNQLGGSGITTIEAALNFFNASSTILCTNMDYPNIVTSGLILNLDAAYTPSFPKNGTTWKDLSGYGNNGTLVNGPSYSSTDGGSLVFNGTNSYVNCGNPTSLQTFSQITLNTWVKFSGLDYVNNTGGLVTFIDKGRTDGPPGTPTSGFWFSYENRLNRNSFNYTCFGNTAGGYAGGVNNLGTKSYTFTNGIWYNITVTVNTSSQGNLFINGVQQGTPVTFSNLDLSNVVENLRIGQYYAAAYYINGNITQTSIYNRALSASEVLQNYYAGLQRFIPTDSLVLSLDGDNTNKQVATASTAYDMSGNNNNGTLNNGTALVSNGQRSFSFDGTNDTITLTATPTSLGMIGGNFTISIWIYNNGTTKGGLVSSQSNSVAGGQYEFSINSANNVQVTYYGGGSVYTSIVSNTWYMLSHTYNYATKSSKLYKNGLLVSSVTMTVDLFTTGQIYIGWYGYGGGYFNGSIGQPRIYSRELTSTEVSTIYTATRSRYGL